MRFFLLLIALIQVVRAQVPATFTHEITFSGETVEVNFALFSNRGPLFAVIEHTADSAAEPDPAGLFTEVEAGEVRTYLGTVTDRPGAMAAGIRRANGEILARVTFADGSEWLDNNNGTVSRRADDQLRFRPPSLPLTIKAGSDVLAADLLIDLPFPYVTGAGGSTAEALEMAEFSMMCINMYFLRDAAVLHQVGNVFVRLDRDLDPYQGMGTTNLLLGEVKNQHKTLLDGTTPDKDHDLGLVASPQVGGGLAFVGVVRDGFSSNGSSANGDFSVVGRHELGHNWGSGHFEGGSPEGRTIMSGNAFGKFSSSELAKILRHRNARAEDHLTNLGKVAPAVPPRAADDVRVAEVGSSPITISPLANDNDTNGGPLTISHTAPQSIHGLVPDLDGEDILLPVTADYAAEADRLFYQIEDETAKPGQAHVFLKSYLAGDVLASFSFEGDASKALDSSSRVAHGSLVNGARMEDGLLILDQEKARVEAEIVTPAGNAMTYAAYVYRDGDQNSWAGLIFQANSNGHMGLNLRTNNELGYHWNNRAQWGFSSKLVVPDQTWTFVAVVVEPTKATLYMDDGSGMRSVINRAEHVAKEHTNYVLGQNVGSGSRFFKGQMDDAVIIQRALNAEEVEKLAEGISYATDPLPRTGTVSGQQDWRLRWAPGASAVSQRLYFSGSYLELRDATPGSAADLGEVSEASFDQAGLPFSHYYWRVDSIATDGSITKGNIWTFEVVDPSLIVDLSMDQADVFLEDGVRKITDLSGSGHHGTFANDPGHTHGQCGGACGLNLEADMKQSISLGTPEGLQFGNDRDFTTAVWVKPARTSQGQVVLSNKDWRSGRNPGFMLGTNSNLRVEWNVGDGSRRRDYDGPASQLPLGEWNHLAVTYDWENTAVVYLNGERLSEYTLRGFESIDTSFPLNIGMDGRGGYRFLGEVDELKIYRRALSDEEIYRLYLRSTHYFKWAEEHYQGLDLVDDSLVAIDADPQGNGLSNLQRYAFQIDPTETDRGMLPSLVRMNGEPGFSFVRLKGGSGFPNYKVNGLEYAIEVSSDLGSANWSATDEMVELFGSPVDEGSGVERVYVRGTGPLANSSRLFFRLRLKQ